MNYSKFSGLVACKMAMLLAFMFAACSDEPSVSPLAQDGGYTEEQGVYALVGRVGDVVPKVMDLKGHDSVPESNDGYLNAAKGTVVIIQELDPLTLDPTGRTFTDTIDNDEGRFELLDSSLASPYVLIGIQDSCIAFDCHERGVWGSSSYPEFRDVPCDYDALIAEDSSWAAALPSSCGVLDSTMYPVPLNAVVDVRKNREISINSLTYMKTPLLKKYFAEGMSFDDASKKAESEILGNYGVYEDLGSFEDAKSVRGELSYVIKMMGDIVRWESGIIDDLPYNIEYYYYGVSPAMVAALGSAAEKTYENTVKTLVYEIGYYARLRDIGRCTDSRENDTSRIDRASIVCHSGKWVPGKKKVDYTTGSMVDDRDGKTYKTVTYNWGNVTQTWMAENLNFVDSVSANVNGVANNLPGNTRCWNGDPSCELFGRFYTWRAAVNVDWASLAMTSVVLDFVEVDGNTVDSLKEVLVEEACLPERFYETEGIFYHKYPGDFRDGPDVAYEYCSQKSSTGECLYLDTAANVYEYCSRRYWRGCRMDLSGLVTPSKPANHQGVCPDGWRIPNKEDWNILSEKIKSLGAALDDEGSGFAFVKPRTRNRVESNGPEWNLDVGTIHDGARFASIPDAEIPVGGPSLYYYIANGFVPDWDENGNVPFYAPNTEVVVRCIKN